MGLVVDLVILEPGAPKCLLIGQFFYPFNAEQHDALKPGDTKFVRCSEGNVVQVDVIELDSERVLRYHCMEGCDLEEMLS